MTGLDFSARAIDAARALAEELDLEARFVEGDVYDAGELIPARFDLVYVTWGTICWLPDIRGWARVAAAALRPGGRLFFADAHPFLLTLDDEKASASDLRVRYPYFHKPAPLRFNEATDYGDAEHTMIHVESYEWMHGPLEVCDALIRAGLALKRLEEFEFLPWNHLPAMWEDEDRLWRLAGGLAANSAFLCDCGPQAVVRDGVCMSPGLC